jgi:endonuclease III
MKRGSEYAKRVKQLYQQMNRKLGKPELPEFTDPLHQLIVGILSENTAESKATSLYKRICEQMVDLNELRVTPPMELADTIGTTVPLAREKAERIIRVLNEIRARQDSLDLSFLKLRGRREAREFLESLEGVGLYAAASVVVHSLGGHAIPVDYLTIYVLRKENIVDESAGPSDVQGFLERNVSAADGRAFSILLNRHVAAEGARVAVNRLPELLNLAPPELPKPRRPGMERPVIVGAKAGDSVPELDGVELEEGLLGDVELEIAVDPEVVDKGGASRKHGGGNSQKKNKKEPARQPAAKKTGDKQPVKSKPREPARKKKG